MDVNDFKYPRRTGQSKLILRGQVEEAIRNTKSNRQAAKYLGVHETTYKKYASLYGLYEGHSNPRGCGISKGFSRNIIPLDDIFAGKYPKYSLIRLKHRMLARHMITEECSYCGFTERRIKDKKSPLILTFKDGDRTNYAQDNFHLVCFNCMFLTAGTPQVAHRSKIVQSFNNPDAFSKSATFDTSKVELRERNLMADEEEQYTEDDFEDLRNEILDELEEH